jgi:hypothetical protein
VTWSFLDCVAHFLRFHRALQWLSHFWISLAIFEILSAHYSDSAILPQWLSHFEISQPFFCDFVSHFWDFVVCYSDLAIFATVTRPFFDFVMPRCSDSAILWFISHSCDMVSHFSDFIRHSRDFTQSFLRFAQSFVSSSICSRMLIAHQLWGIWMTPIVRGNAVALDLGLVLVFSIGQEAHVHTTVQLISWSWKNV